jgi:hypothetical protein
MYKNPGGLLSFLRGKKAKSDVFRDRNTREEVKHATYMTPIMHRTKRISLARKTQQKTINIRIYA